MPGLSSTTAMQQGSGMTIEQLLNKNEHSADSAAVDSTPEAAADDSNAWSAGDSNLSPEPAQVLGFRDNVKKTAQSAADGAAHLKDSVTNKFKSFEASDADSDSADGAEAHTTAVTLTGAVGGIFPSFLSLPVTPHTPPLPSSPGPFSCHPSSSTAPLPQSCSSHSLHHLVYHAKDCCFNLFFQCFFNPHFLILFNCLINRPLSSTLHPIQHASSLCT